MVTMKIPPLYSMGLRRKQTGDNYLHDLSTLGTFPHARVSACSIATTLEQPISYEEASNK